MKKLLLSISIAATAAAIFIGVQVFASEQRGTTQGSASNEAMACKSAKDSAYTQCYIYNSKIEDISSCQCSKDPGGDWKCFVEYKCRS